LRVTSEGVQQRSGFDSTDNSLGSYQCPENSFGGILTRINAILTLITAILPPSQRRLNAILPPINTV
jgi:hypothetical protein